MDGGNRPARPVEIPDPLLGSSELPPAKLAAQPGRPRVKSMNRLGEPLW
jgi:hypothetical protein